MRGILNIENDCRYGSATNNKDTCRNRVLLGVILSARKDFERIKISKEVERS